VEGTEAGDVLWGMGGMRWTGGGRAEKKKGELAPGFDLKMEEGGKEGRGARRETESHGGNRGKFGPYIRAGVGFARNLGPCRARLLD